MAGLRGRIIGQILLEQAVVESLELYSKNGLPLVCVPVAMATGFIKFLKRKHVALNLKSEHADVFIRLPQLNLSQAQMLLGEFYAFCDHQVAADGRHEAPLRSSPAMDAALVA